MSRPSTRICLSAPGPRFCGLAGRAVGVLLVGVAVGKRGERRVGAAGRLHAAAIALVMALAPMTGSAGVRPRYGGELRALLPAVPAEVDPARATSPSDLSAVRALHATLLEVDPSGRLRPGLLEAVPVAEEGGRSFRLRLSPGLRFQDGSPITAGDVARSLSRLAAPWAAHSWVAAPIRGFEAVHDGRAPSLSGLEVLSDSELRVKLAYPFDDFPRALAALPAAIVRIGPGGEVVGAGPFRPASSISGRSLRMTAFEGCAAGRPFADALVLGGSDARGAARAMARAEADIALRPEALPGVPTVDATLDEVVVALVSHRLGRGAGPTHATLAALDRAELAHWVRGPAKPLTSLLPDPHLAPRSPRSEPPRGVLPSHLALLVSTEPGAPRAAAERIQVKLYDRGVRVAIDAEPRRVFESRLSAGDFDLALVPVRLLARSPALALGELAWALRGPARGAEVLSRAAGTGSSGLRALAAALERELLAVPLYATGLRLSARAGVQGVARAGDGTWTVGDTWLLPGAAGRAP